MSEVRTVQKSQLLARHGDQYIKERATAKYVCTYRFSTSSSVWKRRINSGRAEKITQKSGDSHDIVG